MFKMGNEARLQSSDQVLLTYEATLSIPRLFGTLFVMTAILTFGFVRQSPKAWLQSKQYITQTLMMMKGHEKKTKKKSIQRIVRV
jgi:hypothetical protein